MLCGCSLQSRRNTERSSRSCSCQGWTVCKVTGLVEAATQEDVPPCRWHWLLGTRVADGSCLVGGLLGVIQRCRLAGLPGCTQPSPAPGMRCLQARISLTLGLYVCPVPRSQSWHRDGTRKEREGISWSRAFQSLEWVWEGGGEK